jgi:AcrR family transcriptional regulator
MAAPGRTRGNYAKTAGRRREILEAGIDVFSTNGFRSGSIREIAERVGMSQAGLLHHFPSKTDLLAEVLRLRDEKALEILRSDTPPGIDTLRDMVELVAHNATVPGLVELHCVLSAEATSPDHPAHDYFRERYDRTIRSMEEAFAQLERDGQLAPGLTPSAAARGLVAMSDGLQVQWLLDPASVDMADEMRRYLQLLVTVKL